MTIERHTVAVGDTLTPMGCQLKQRSLTGIPTPVNLSGLTVKFQMRSSAGVVKVAETVTGVTVIDAANGKVQYDFQSADVDTEGTYFGWFTVYSGTERDTFPVAGREMLINIIKSD